MAIVLPSVACLADDTHDAKCRASRRLLDLGNPLEVARASVVDKKELRIIAMGSSSTQGYGASNPAFAYPAQLKMNLEKILPGVSVHVYNMGVGGQDADEEVARMKADVKEHKADVVVWQVGTNSAIRRTPLDRFANRLRAGIDIGKSLGADFLLMNLQYVPAVVAVPDKEAYEKVMASAAKEFSAGLFRRYDIMRGWYDDGMPYAQFVQLDGLHLNDFGQKCIGRLLTRSIVSALTGP